MSTGCVSQYAISLKAGPSNLSSHLRSVRLYTDRAMSMQVIHIDVDLNREQYKSYIQPFKDKIILEIVSSTGLEHDSSVPDVDASFSYELTVVKESSTQGMSHMDGSVSPMSCNTLICVSNKMLKIRQKLIKNLVFIDKTRKQMIQEIFNGADLVIESDIHNENEVIEQIVLPPMRQIAACTHIDHYCNLFKSSRPTYITYGIDGKVYIGSCIKNVIKPINIYVGSDDTLEHTVQAAGKSSTIFDYSITKPIQESIRYNDICIGLGKKQSYCFSPLNKLFSRVELDLNEIDTSMVMHNVYGDDPKLGDHVKKSNKKETWFKEHMGLADVDGDSDNRIFAENYITEYANQAIVLAADVEGPVKFKDFLYIGKKVKLTCGSNSVKYDGDYYLDSCVMNFHYKGKFWVGEVSIKLNGSINLRNL